MEVLADFNEKQIRLLFGDDASLMEQVLDILQADIPAHLSSLDQAISSKAGDRVYEIAHTLKGSLANVGAEKGSSLAAHILREAEAHHYENCRGLYGPLQETTEIFLREFAAAAARKKEGT